MAETQVSAPEMVPFEERMPRPPLVEHTRSMAWLTDLIAGVPERKTPLWWFISIAITGSIAAFGVFCILYLLFTGVRVWANDIPLGCALDITNFELWVRIGHAVSLI